jgi:2,4-dienoyl-CoA reductase-like NADH-dependent reductase (Old Yellow Enzyme family)
MSQPIPTKAESKLFEPLTIANGNITLKHRVIFAPLTRNRGTPLSLESTPKEPNRVWVPNDLMVEYYTQRASDGGLIISEGLPPSLEVSAHSSIICFLFSCFL